jgi:uncharacterized membrane protein
MCEAAVLSAQSGHIRFINIGQLVAVAKAWGISVHVARRVGQFVPAGVPIVYVSKPERVPPERAVHLIAAFDIGPTRTLQQDVESPLLLRWLRLKPLASVSLLG